MKFLLRIGRAVILQLPYIGPTHIGIRRHEMIKLIEEKCPECGGKVVINARVHSGGLFSYFCTDPSCPYEGEKAMPYAMGGRQDEKILASMRSMRSDRDWL